LPLDNPAITTLCDISHVRHPEFHPPGRVALLEALLPDVLRRSARIVTISEFTRRELAEHYALSESDISIVPPAVSADFFPRSGQQCASVRERYQLPQQFVLSLGTLEPRKNLVGLIEAYRQLPASLRDQYPLVIAGGSGWQSQSLELSLRGLPAHQVIRTGYVDQCDLPVLLAAATLMAYPSFYEGFGMPVLEAMASGVPVLTSQASAMSQLCAGAAVLVDPHSAESIAAGLEGILVSPEDRQQKRGAGLLVAANYRWSGSAAVLRDVFAEVVQ